MQIKTIAALWAVCVSLTGNAFADDSNAMKTVGRAIEAMGGYKLANIRAITLKGQGRHFEPQQSLRPDGDAVPSGASSFVTTIDLVASLNGEQIDQAQNISYEIGSGTLLDGIDEALITLTAGETTIFKSKLVGGDKAGEEAESKAEEAEETFNEDAIDKGLEAASESTSNDKD